MSSPPLISCTEAQGALPRRKADSTIRRWLRLHPDLGQRVGGRYYLHGPALQAIASGVSLSEAAEIGRRCREHGAA
jgi:hypothetical protein